jgi:hypothetical protein
MFSNENKVETNCSERMDRGLGLHFRRVANFQPLRARRIAIQSKHRHVDGLPRQVVAFVVNRHLPGP